jgi:hypothetical protein
VVGWATAAGRSALAPAAAGARISTTADTNTVRIGRRGMALTDLLISKSSNGELPGEGPGQLPRHDCLVACLRQALGGRCTSATHTL